MTTITMNTTAMTGADNVLCSAKNPYFVENFIYILAFYCRGVNIDIDRHKILGIDDPDTKVVIRHTENDIIAYILKMYISDEDNIEFVEVESSSFGKFARNTFYNWMVYASIIPRYKKIIYRNKIALLDYYRIMCENAIINLRYELAESR